MTDTGTTCTDCDETFCSDECAEADDRAFHADWEARMARARARYWTVPVDTSDAT